MPIRLYMILVALVTLASSTAQANEPVRLAINLSPISALPLIAKEKGLFEKHGLDVRITNFSSGRQALETVIGGGADIATAAESPVTAAVFAGQNVQLLARMEYSELKTVVVVPGVKDVAGLKGKRIGYTAGTGSEVYTHELLKRAQLTKNDVTLVNLRPQDMIAAAASGSIDAYNIWEPFVANGRKALGATASVIKLANVYSETFNVVLTQAYQAKHPQVSIAFLRALLEAESWLKANREAAIALVGKAVGLAPAELAEVWNDYVFELVLDKRTLDVLSHHAQWRIDTGNAAGDAKAIPDFRKVIHAAPLSQVAPERVKI
jgi:ABC-type nitrate/sulfonate/bicarbonate transport system substrate-binding protein